MLLVEDMARESFRVSYTTIFSSSIWNGKELKYVKLLLDSLDSLH